MYPNCLLRMVTLKIRARSPESYLYCVTMIQDIKFGKNPSFSSSDSKQKHNFCKKIDISKPWCDLENKVTVTKI